MKQALSSFAWLKV